MYQVQPSQESTKKSGSESQGLETATESGLSTVTSTGPSTCASSKTTTTSTVSSTVLKSAASVEDRSTVSISKISNQKTTVLVSSCHNTNLPEVPAVQSSNQHHSAQTPNPHVIQVAVSVHSVPADSPLYIQSSAENTDSTNHESQNLTQICSTVSSTQIITSETEFSSETPLTQESTEEPQMSAKISDEIHSVISQISARLPPVQNEIVMSPGQGPKSVPARSVIDDIWPYMSPQQGPKSVPANLNTYLSPDLHKSSRQRNSSDFNSPYETIKNNFTTPEASTDVHNVNSPSLFPQEMGHMSEGPRNVPPSSNTFRSPHNIQGPRSVPPSNSYSTPKDMGNFSSPQQHVTAASPFNLNPLVISSPLVASPATIDQGNVISAQAPESASVTNCDNVPIVATGFINLADHAAALAATQDLATIDVNSLHDDDNHSEEVVVTKVIPCRNRRKNKPKSSTENKSEDVKHVTEKVKKERHEEVNTSMENGSTSYDSDVPLAQLISNKVKNQKENKSQDESSSDDLILVKEKIVKPRRKRPSRATGKPKGPKGSGKDTRWKRRKGSILIIYHVK